MRFFAAALIFFGAAASYAQSPVVPHKMPFAGMTLVIHDDARKEIQKDVDALTQHPRYFQMKVERARTYFPIIERIFDEEGIPTDIKYLVLQESALVPDAVSVSNAVGYWQFKDFTALEMGLRVDKEIDERMNLISASRGAARYLKKSNSFFNNWIYSIQSYQMGAGGVRRLIGDQHKGVKHMDITSQTYWYVKKFLAHKIAFEHAVSGVAQLNVVLYENKSRKAVKDLAQEVSVDESKLREFNKWIKGSYIPDDRSYVVVVPTSRSDVDFNNLVLASSKAGKAQPLEPKQAVAPSAKFLVNGLWAIKGSTGESLSAMAKRADLPIATFMKYNEVEIDHVPESGRHYFLQKKKRVAEASHHQVRAGEDAWSVSQLYGIQLRQLQKYNQLNSNKVLVAGSTLKLQAKGSSPKVQEPTEVLELDTSDFFSWDFTTPVLTSPELLQMDVADSSAAPVVKMPVLENEIPDEHHVSAKETLYSISRQYGVAITDLLAWNNLSAQQGIYPGQRLVLRAPSMERPPSDGDHEKAKPGIPQTHTVQASDTLYSIARQYGITIQALMTNNGKRDFVLTVGEKLKIPDR
jgi:membrane-bound lytic murein transglycosylase D